MPHLVRIYPAGEFARFALKGPTALIGRGSDCDVKLDDVSVSRHHARLTLMADGWSVEDLESTNGTYVNDVSILKSRLRDTDFLRVGNIVLKFDATDSSGEPPPGGADPEGSAAATVRISRN